MNKAQWAGTLALTTFIGLVMFLAGYANIESAYPKGLVFGIIWISSSIGFLAWPMVIGESNRWLFGSGHVISFVVWLGMSAVVTDGLALVMPVLACVFVMIWDVFYLGLNLKERAWNWFRTILLIIKEKS